MTTKPGDAIREGDAVPFEVRVRAEIWESLVSMLRVYANAAALNSGECAVTARSDAAWVRHRGVLLKLSFDPESGAGSWRLTDLAGAERSGDFELLEDGALRFGGEAMELDQAAIEWMEEIARAAAERRAS